MRASDCVPLVAVTRGDIVESIHFGGFIIVDSHGKILALQGAKDLLTYPRSSMKPFQLLPFIEHGGIEAFGFTEQEIAIMCASHSGTDLHVSVLKGMHEKIGSTENDLGCGIHWPGDAWTRQTMRAAGETPTPFRHNCSGKHTGMLAHAKLRNLEIGTYLDPDHPIQVSIRETLAEMLEMNPAALPLGIDGCSAPVYGIPITNMARAIAKIADPISLSPSRAAACKKITSAMMNYPVMVAGPGKFDTDLMTAAKGKVFSKGGAEGYQVIGVMPNVVNQGSPGLGIAIKISDGDAAGRARAFVALSLLKALGIFDDAAMEGLKKHGDGLVKNWRGILVGEMRLMFPLNF